MLGLIFLFIGIGLAVIGLAWIFHIIKNNIDHVTNALMYEHKGKQMRREKREAEMRENGVEV